MLVQKRITNRLRQVIIRNDGGTIFNRNSQYLAYAFKKNLNKIKNSFTKLEINLEKQSLLSCTDNTEDECTDTWE